MVPLKRFLSASEFGTVFINIPVSNCMFNGFDTFVLYVTAQNYCLKYGAQCIYVDIKVVDKKRVCTLFFYA